MGSPAYNGMSVEGGLSLSNDSLSTTDTAGKADRIIAWIQATTICWIPDRVVVHEIMHPTGPKPGSATIEIGVATGHEVANVVALSAPWQAILHNAVVCLGRQRAGFPTHWFWNGKVATVAADIVDDMLMITAKDDRLDMGDVRIVGRFVVEPGTAVGNIAWQQGWPAVFNEGGRPNMMLSNIVDDDGVAIPGFSQSDYGMSEDGRVPDSNSPFILTQIAGYWTLSWVLRYLSVFYSYGADKYYGTGDSIPKLAPSTVRWPRGLGSQMDVESNAFWDEGRGQSKGSTLGAARKGRELPADGMDVLSAIELMVATAGGYTIGWDMSAIPDGSSGMTPSSNLNLVTATYRGGVGGTINIIRGGTAAVQIPDSGGRAFTRGNYTEDSSDMVTSAYAMGSLVKIETRIDTLTYLKPRWSADALAAMIAEGTSRHIASAEGLRGLFAKYPQVFAYYQLDDTWNFYTGTDEILHHRAQVPRYIMPHLLSWVGGVALDYGTANFSVKFEISINSGAKWTPTTELNRLSVMDDGTIDLTALREIAIAHDSHLPGSWCWTGSGFWNWTKMAATDIRCTVAIPCDHRLTAVCNLVSEQLEYTDIVPSQDAARLSPNMRKQNVLDLRQLYHLWMRYRSWPRPESFYSEPMAPDKNMRDNALRNDSDLLRAHTRRHMYLNGKLKRGGFVGTPQILTTIPLGYQIQDATIFTGNDISTTVPLNCVVRALRWAQSESDELTIDTECWLG